MDEWTRVDVLVAEGERVSVRVPEAGPGPLPNDVTVVISRMGGLPAVFLQQGGEVVETFFELGSASIKQTCTSGASSELVLRGRQTLLRLTCLLVQTADGAVEDGTSLLFDRLASGREPMSLGVAMDALRAQIGRIVWSTGISALFLIDDADGPVIAYVTEGRAPLRFGGFKEAARLSAITGQDFRWEPRYAGRVDKFPDAALVWVNRW
ncbi:hypothetical protein E3O19_04380 [Cryobacterium algoritolerans]|uniref:Uncharacterized protein n=1 Tax=Cryobacterium algoritolerans TaxID=1259184 RepID=A0A4R8WYX7_9MICO|nr:hypothetical protein [Cryobacterium algoritolerans]TFC18611.1 hypothetical protein E3O19_04380 [Cryobacterium algoritolerans]